ncbi:hypothetical protein EDE12_101358 [Methylosinus sp. sav-2]|uniref:hypothetical protein n=1 Tax=Methylosinus sp. sav-2 TaxID=2485168 RepID=UPI00047ED35D|nr:hypothetical protein [Methylosinus sp. sav-2]TDX66822.1 hypothetical protein EDE12_101358 [Methylosinus sp. sav-2]
MRILIGMDDTDGAGWAASTARLAREFGDTLASETRFIGSVGHILFSGVTATTNNKASCLVVESERADAADFLLAQAAAYVEANAAPSSAPGIVVAGAEAEALIDFGRAASRREIRPEELPPLIEGLRVAGLRGGRGLIGAAAAVGLTARGWSGRWLEFGGLRRLDRAVQARELRALGIFLVSLETDAEAPAPDDWIDTHGRLRPQLAAGRAVLPLRRIGEGMWEAATGEAADAAPAKKSR